MVQMLKKAQKQCKEEASAAIVHQLSKSVQMVLAFELISSREGIMPPLINALVNHAIYRQAVS
jgi:hypothetical protein